MRVAPDGSEIRVTMPRWGQSADAVDFARSRLSWIEKQLTQSAPVTPPTPGQTIRFRGSKVTIEWNEKLPRTPKLDDATLRIGGPEGNLSTRIERWLRKEAQQTMAVDLAHYCAAAGVDTPDLGLSRAQRRWGSCSTSGTVRMNWRLIMAPENVRRSVVAHEVAHLVHFDHSREFYALLDQLFEGDLPAANRWLKDHGRSLYRQFG
jgi:predicted metal-dependent hydrolase